jgi:hypothetical protein
MTGTSGKSIPNRKHEEKELQRLRTKDYWMKVQRTKLLMDLIFVCEYIWQHAIALTHTTLAFDVFNLKRGKRTAQTLSGLASGILRYDQLSFFLPGRCSYYIQLREAIQHAQGQALRHHQFLTLYSIPDLRGCSDTNLNHCASL